MESNTWLYSKRNQCIFSVVQVYGYETEPVLLNVYGAPELIPRNEFRHPM